MKIDMTQVLPGMDGEPMQTDGVSVKCPECQHAIQIEEREPLTLKRVCLNALNQTRPDGNTLKHKEQQGEIMVALLLKDEPDLESERIAIVKEMLGVSPWRPWVVHVAALMLEGRELPDIPAVESQGKEPSPPAKA